MAMIEFEHLTKQFGNFTAVNDITFSVAEGAVFGFIGPNGAGKTTTIRIISTILDPTAGSVYVDGHSVVDEPECARAVIGYMPDEYGVYDGVSVAELTPLSQP